MKYKILIIDDEEIEISEELMIQYGISSIEEFIKHVNAENVSAGLFHFYLCAEQLYESISFKI